MSNVTQRAFSGGELSPALWARTDFAKYMTGLRTCRNMEVMRTGGVRSRMGTEFVWDTNSPTQAARLIPFIFSMSDALVLVLTDRSMRLIQNGVDTGVVLTTPYLYTEIFDLHYVQSGDVVTFTHPNHQIFNLVRSATGTWSFTLNVFGPVISGPGSVVVTGTSGTIFYFYWVTAVSAETGEESLPTVDLSNALLTAPTAAQPHTVAWYAVPGAGYYRVYRQAPFQENSMGFIGQTSNTEMTDSGIAADFSQQAPAPRSLFDAPRDFPSEVSYCQQRRIFANSLNNPETIWTSKTGNFENFLISTPLEDDDAVTFQLAGRQVSRVRFILDLGKILICTEGGEWIADGDPNGVLTPSSVNTRVGSYNGCANIRPILVDNTILYVQSLGTKVLELQANIMYGYYTFVGADHTLISGHLFEGYTIVDWAYAQIPNYTIWACRSDGTLLGFTYIKAEQMAAWHRHDTLGAFESVCTIPEGDHHATYFIVRRTINGQTVRYVERMNTRFIDGIVDDIVSDAAFMDCAGVYDGREAGVSSGIVLTLTGGTNWTYDEVLTLTASASEFASMNVGDQRVLRDAAGNTVRFTIQSITGPTVAKGTTDITVPVDLRGISISDWDRAVRAVAGLDYLEGQNVAVYADGYVVGSPNNPAYPSYTVTHGVVTLDQPRAYIRVGLPYYADAETLDIDTPEGPSMKERKVNVTAVGAYVQASRGVFAGVRDDDVTGLTDAQITATLQEMQLWNSGTNPWTKPVALSTKYIEETVQGRWNSNGRVFFRQIDPLPFTLLSATPLGFIPRGGKS